MTTNQVAALESERDEARAELQRLHNDTQEAFAAIAVKQKRDAERIAELEARLTDATDLVDRVRSALAGHPRCDVHPNDDVISCGWKRAVGSVRHALDAVPLDAAEVPDVE